MDAAGPAEADLEHHVHDASVPRHVAAPRAVRRAVGQVDRRFVARSAQWRPTPMDRAMITLSRSANKGQLWIGVAAILVASGGNARRGAVRGAIVLGASTLVASRLLKPLFPRNRPPEHSIPGTRRFGELPTTPSFPSAHAALAAAFATGVAIESPIAGYFIAPLAAAVAYSRVHTGVHWPSDVVAGGVVGVSVALLTRQLWSAPLNEPATTDC
ncbi:phosphatase PAP2 family protein [Hoyosella rhizosphaerae]|uniref:Phosphatidic acid phosphatase type 2/haloperoxidase domain-containing protein n=1 Tax=Hoyosella rhizosphaerae TaxID=1755582 RepID=A0A916X8G4_9ACTN|nr:phosphatase PAP2 family protein [Hoyosella rhizosphaerae]MBN4927082.1 phosphatase PAP2 family protein [Hoyosella rhizosphaerae]GGC54204.1 hypothetical protein GCM10011410_03170 [Hoyosella rhizosphaerae]